MLTSNERHFICFKSVNLGVSAEEIDAPKTSGEEAEAETAEFVSL